MHTDQRIPTDERLFGWLAEAIEHIHRGSIHLTIERGNIRSVEYRNERHITTLDELQPQRTRGPEPVRPTPMAPDALFARLRRTARRFRARVTRR